MGDKICWLVDCAVEELCDNDCIARFVGPFPSKLPRVDYKLANKERRIALSITRAFGPARLTNNK